MVSGKVRDFYEREIPVHIKVYHKKHREVASFVITRFAAKSKFFSISILADITIKNERNGLKYTKG